MTDVDTAMRAAATRLLGPVPGRLDVPCRACRAPAGAECRWRRAPGPPTLHGARHRRARDWYRAHRAVVAALAEWAAADAVDPDGPASWEAEERTRAGHAGLRHRCEAVGVAAPELPSPAAVRAEAAGAGVAL